MYKSATWLMASAVLVLLVPQGGAAANEWTTSAPEAGTYQGEMWINSVSGGGCIDVANNAFIASLSFPGLSGATWNLRALETGPNAGYVSVNTLTVKSGKGTTTPSGGFVWTGSGIGGGGWSETGTFTSTVTEIGTHAFVLQLTEKYNSCTEVVDIPFARIGVNQ